MLEKAPGIDAANRDLLIAGAGAALTVVEQAGAARLAEAASEISKLQAELAAARQPPAQVIASAPAAAVAPSALSTRAAEGQRIVIETAVDRINEIAKYLEDNGDADGANRIRASTARFAATGDVGFVTDVMTIAVEASNAGMSRSRKRAAEAMVDPVTAARQQQVAAVKTQWANWRPGAVAAAPAASSSTMHIASAPKRAAAAPAAAPAAPAEPQWQPIGNHLKHLGIEPGAFQVMKRAPTW